jgi:hypothetical protein
MRLGAKYAIAATLLCIAASTSAGQDTRLRPGATIRFNTDTTARPHIGELARATPDSLLLQRCPTCARLGYSLAEVDRLAVFRRVGRGTRFITGYGLGGLIGLGVGALIANACNGIGDECDGTLIIVPAAGVLGGLVVGLIHYWSTPYTWDPIPSGRR